MEKKIAQDPDKANQIIRIYTDSALQKQLKNDSILIM